MSVQRTGDWDRARRALAGGGRRLGRVLRVVVYREAHRLRAEILTGLRKQAPGGEAFRPLSKLTLAARRLAGFRGSKALMRTGDLRNSITVLPTAPAAEAFVGVPRASGKVRIAEIHEYGTNPIVIPITPKMRRFLGALFKRATRTKKREKRRGNGTKLVVVQIPARPFLRPAIEAWKRGVGRRVEAEIRLRMGWR